MKSLSFNLEAADFTVECFGRYYHIKKYFILNRRILFPHDYAPSRKWYEIFFIYIQVQENF